MSTGPRSKATPSALEIPAKASLNSLPGYTTLCTHAWINLLYKTHIGIRMNISICMNIRSSLFMSSSI